MNETKRKLDFFTEFIDKIEQEGKIVGSRQTPFLQEMLPFINIEDEPAIMYFSKKEMKVQLNGYIYQEDVNTLSLYVVEYEPFLEESDLPIANMTLLKEYANKAKRFYTNAEQILQLADRSMEYYDVAKMIVDKKGEIEEINIYVVTSKFYISNKPIDLNIPNVETVNVHVWDMDRIFKLSEAEQGIREFDIHFESEYGSALQMMHIPNENENGLIDCYIGVIPAKLLAELYDEWGPKLVERNVRSFLQARGGTNKGIRDTLKDARQRELFIAYNNGISSVAKAGDIERIGDSNLFSIKTLTSWQIVNGGQTTASIHQAYKNDIDLEGVYVQTKLTIINVPQEIENNDAQMDRHVFEDEMISKISEYANTQNKINKSDLLANTRFMSDIEKFSRNIWIPTQDNRKEESKWYFERARGQYMVDIGRRSKGKEQTAFKKMYPKENVITKVEMAKYFMSWEGFPYVSSKGGEEAFKRFMDLNSLYWKQSSITNDEGEVIKSILSIDNEYYKKLIARKIINAFVTEIVESMKLKGYRANVIYYTVAMLNYLYGKEIDLIEVWQHQALSNKWEDVVRTIANNALNYLRESAGDQNVTQWAKKEDCWKGFIKESAVVLSSLI
ncbi:AIPR family protein [Bacillus pacificus]|uniref:AIPR family protein n=1 Tax=Bacillus TaxID=1386 RepID=UPI0003475DCF|nr:AIPR family protein [Bacillus pacificus]MCC2419569.1 AIPR family protein [Bacillus pacificus]MCU5008818.1 AIPR family protein [Bacillus pacificus]MCU5259512.1 AIPR family protein [Bacillus pacificus]MCU5562036.1 AIPR family protein [Bacillus pacificus]HDR3524595.1 AIPR family protein [Bacillus pacificus]